MVHLVEVGYTSDMRVHEHMQIKLDQHCQLRQNLLSYGWGRVNVHAFIVGHTGVMSQANDDILQELGISSPSIDSVLADLAVSSLQKSCAILSCFPKVSKRPDMACDDGRNDDGLAGLQAALTPHSAGSISESHATLSEGRGGMTPNGLDVTAHPPLGGGQSAEALRPILDVHLAPHPHQISLVPAEQPLHSSHISRGTCERAISVGPGPLSFSLLSDPSSSTPGKRRRLALPDSMIFSQKSGLQSSHTGASVQPILLQSSLPGAPADSKLITVRCHFCCSCGVPTGFSKAYL